MDRKEYEAKTGALWSQFAEIATRDEQDATTGMALDELSAALDRLELAMERQQQVKAGSLYPAETPGILRLGGRDYQYERGTAAHAQFIKLLRVGIGGLPEAQRDRVPLPDHKRLDEMQAAQQKAMLRANDVGGGYLASPEFSSEMLRLSLDYSPVRALARVVPVGVASGLLQPVRTGVVAAQRVDSEITDRAATDDADFKLEQIPDHEAFASYKVSRALLADSTYPLDAEIAEAASRAFAVLEGSEFVKGTGNGEFKGLNAESLPTAQVVATTGTSSTIAAVDLFKFVYEGLHEQYQPNATILLTAKALSAIRQLAATSGNTYLYGGFGGPGRTILDVPYRLVPDLDAPGTKDNVLAYIGDFYQAYTVASRMDIVVQRLDERHAESGLVEFIVYERSGGQVTNPDALARLIAG